MPAYLDIAISLGADPHTSQTSTGTGNVITLPKPGRAVGCYLKCETTGCRVTFDGSTPDATNGIPIATTDAPLFFPVGRDIKAVSQAAANSVVHVMWIEPR